MKHGFAGAALAALVATAGTAEAGDLSFGAGLRDLMPESSKSDGFGMRYGAGLRDMVPAPIPVPMANPVPEGFTYYLRADLNWGFSDNRSFSESGALYGPALTPFTSAGIPFTSDTDSVFGGTIGFGAYFTPRIRGDLTLDFRQDKENVFTGSYTYTSGGTVNGSIRDSIKLSSVVGLANVYFDILPRGAFSPYIGGGIGFVYNDLNRTYQNNETGALTSSRSATGRETDVGLAAALMAGATISLDPRWAVDIGYRALYTDGGTVSATIPTPTTQTSKVTLGDNWEHQVRVGLRFNIW